MARSLQTQAFFDRHPSPFNGPGSNYNPSQNPGSGANLNHLSGLPGLGAGAGVQSPSMIQGGGVSSITPGSMGVQQQGPVAGNTNVSVRGRFNGYSQPLQDYYLQQQNVNAPKFGDVRDVSVDPYSAQGISGVRDASANMINPNTNMINPNMNWGGVNASTTGQSGLSGEMERQAQAGLELGGQLSNQDMRASSQQARQAFSDRGLGRSNPAVFAEALNRDQYSRARQGERRGFAQSVEQQGQQQRQFDAGQTQAASLANAQGNLSADQSTMQGNMANQNARLQSSMANQSAGLQSSMANQGMDYNVGSFNAGAQNAANQFNTQTGLQAALANQNVDLSSATTQYGGQLQASLANQNMMQQEYDRDLQVQLANQNANLNVLQQEYQGGLQAQLANQSTALQAGLGNLNAGTSMYNTNSNVNQARWNFFANSLEGQMINQQNQSY